jgi:signal transduction histidine kinase
MRRTRRQNVTYAALLAGAFLLALWMSWQFGGQVDNFAYDVLLRLHPPALRPPESIILAIEESTSRKFHGVRGIRQALAEGLERIAPAKPKAVAIDVILADTNPELDDRLEAAFAHTPNLVLDCLTPDDETWELPLPRFLRHAVGTGHVYVHTNQRDQVARELPLQQVAGRQSYWALALEAFRVSRGASIVPQDPAGDVEVGSTTIPTAIGSNNLMRRLMRIRFTANPPIPRVSIKELVDHPELASRFAGKTVFIGETTRTSGDRKMTPLGEMPGVEIHAQAFETIARGDFLTPAHTWVKLVYAALLVIAAGLVFAYLPGWQANVAAGLILLAGSMASYVFFTRNIVFSFITPFSAAWLSVVMAAGYEHLVVRRALRRAEADRVRYQQSLHFVTHEMRTPLTAIQGSSELIGRYANMPPEKRTQMAQLINSESKRLARMIEMFLNVERLSAGQMELKKETFEVADLMTACVDRVRPLAERKQIQITFDPPRHEKLAGDRELMEYAFYNLLTNAVKYSPQRTEVTTGATRQNGHIRISVQDQGIGMDQKEVRKIFQKFYRTKKAEESGEAGTGIGLSIVEQIVSQHGGTIEVKSRPGEGSCFTLVLPAPSAGEESS